MDPPEPRAAALRGAVQNPQAFNPLWAEEYPACLRTLLQAPAHPFYPWHPYHHSLRPPPPPPFPAPSLGQHKAA